jgi:hypothetical protein
MNNRLKLGAVLFAAAGTFAFAGAAPANAAACPQPGSFALSSLVPLAFSCDQGGFTFTLNSFSGFAGSDSISFSNPTATTFTYNLNSNTPWTSGSKVLNYSLTAPSGKLLTAHTSSLTGSLIPPGGGTYTVAGTNSTAAVMVNNATAPGFVSYPVNLASDTFTATLGGLSGSGAQQVTSTYAIVDAPTSAVPGPLPIFGAAAAFGFSRKVRNRIKAAA